MPASHSDSVSTNGHHDDVSRPSTPSKKPATASKGKKTAGGKSTSDEATRLLQARISQLEQDATNEKDQELEIEREVKRANRDLVQSISKMDSMQKIDYLTKRSSELLADMRRLEKDNQKNKRSRDNLQKERDGNRTELSKTVGLKEKLEKLCRELQRDNNKMKNENKELQTAHTRNTTAWDEKYATLLTKVEGYQEAKDTPKRQVVDMEMEELFRVRFKSFIDQYELRELHFHSLMRTKELEVQFHMSRFEREKKAADAESVKCRQLQAQVSNFTKTESELRAQLNVYVDKFKQQVEDTLNNSNDLFLSFRREMEDMSKKSKRFERDNEVLVKQKDAANANVLRLAGERQEWKKRTDKAEKQIETLRGIIQAMQKQGRSVPPSLVSTMESCFADSRGGREGDEESDYSVDPEELVSQFGVEIDIDNDIDNAADDDDDDDDDDTEEENQPPGRPAPVTYGPERPPHSKPATSINGH